MASRSGTDDDPSNGYEAVAAQFIAARQQSRIGVASIRAWGRSVGAGASVLDLGCGFGGPIWEALLDEGVVLYGVDASASLVAALRSRFPSAHVAHEAVEDSRFFGRTFDGVVAVGLLFLLPGDAQRDLVRRVAGVLNPGGRFLFTAPARAATWTDVLTGHTSCSLGAEAYRAILAEAGLAVLGEHVDEGENYYYDAYRGRSFGIPS